MSKHVGPSEFVRFRANTAFDFLQSTCAPESRQFSDGSKQYYTRNRVFRSQVLATRAPVTVLDTAARLRALPAEKWRRDYGRQKVLFILPSDALGDCVGVILFLRSFRAAWPLARITVANTGAATDLFTAEPGLQVLPLFISEKELDAHFPVIDLGEVDGWDAVSTQPVDVESVLLERFGLAPCPVERPASTSGIAILPLASSPLRTLPPRLVAELAQAMAGKGPVRVVLNAYQAVSAAYDKALRPLIPNAIDIVGGFQTTSELRAFMARQAFLITADSGPAHVSKLFATPGVAIYTSASGKVLQGRHRNLACWQSPYNGPNCSASCGLAKVRATDDGRIGCMGSLGVPLDALCHLPPDAQPALVQRMILDQPVPCVAELDARRQEIAAMARTLLP